MLGLLITESKINILTSNILNVKEDIYKEENYYFCRKTLKKFLDDKVFYNGIDYFFMIDGVILNKKELVIEYGKSNFEELIIDLYREKEAFFHKFKGSFSGVFYDKINKKIIIFTDQLGIKKIYYYLGENLLVSSNLYEIIDILKLNKIEYSLNLLAAYSLLTYGSMIENITLVNEIKFLKAGEYIKYENNNLKVIRYHKFKKEVIKEQSEEEIIEKIDKLFNKAIKLQVEKNKEYGYLNLAPLSAGLDSRMTNFVLKRYVKDEVINITYSQNNYRDEKISKKIASELGNHWIYKSLNNGLSLKLLEEVNELTYGGVNSYGAAQVLDIVKVLNFNNIGIIHTGMFGEALAGVEVNFKELTFVSKRLEVQLKERIGKNLFEKFDNFEIFNYYNGSFLNTFMGSPKVFQIISESFSPFYDIDFIQYIINIPPNLRKNYNIYDKWVLKKYPEASKYLHNGRKIGGKSIKIFKRTVSLNQLIPRLTKYFLRKIKLKNEELATENHMNPLDLWYKKNLKLKEYLDSIFENIINEIKEEQLKIDCKNVYINGNMKEKDLVLTLLISYRRIFLRR